ncbi:transporter [Metabacillus arenae]|uniref:Transporter n=1 Tax=Metabacillus arenae TaxID=2771434 RepID=A0A926NFH0_9BACI|nr:transporter [Metabacillus arenae]MBD1383317.1 transporter [Metabacillus arenae]
MYPYHRQFPGFPPGFPPGTDGSGQGQAPSGPPPSYIPQQQDVGLYAVDPGGIRGCLYRFTYVRLNNGRAFWYYPTFVGRNSVAGFRWRPNQYRWVYFGIDLDRIRSYTC